MSSFDSDPNNFNNTAYNNNNNDFQNPGRRGEFDNQPDNMRSTGTRPGEYGQGRFDNSSAGGGFDQQTPNRNQFSTSGYNDDSFGPTETNRGYGSGNQRSYGDTTGTQGYGTGNDFEHSRSTGSAYGTGNDFSSGRDDDYSSYGAENISGNKPTFGDKMKGTAEIATGKMTKNPGMVERGQERKLEGSNF